MACSTITLFEQAFYLGRGFTTLSVRKVKELSRECLGHSELIHQDDTPYPLLVLEELLLLMQGHRSTAESIFNSISLERTLVCLSKESWPPPDALLCK